MLTLKMTSNCKQFKGGLIMISVRRYAKYTVNNNFQLIRTSLTKRIELLRDTIKRLLRKP